MMTLRHLSLTVIVLMLGLETIAYAKPPPRKRPIAYVPAIPMRVTVSPPPRAAPPPIEVVAPAPPPPVPVNAYLSVGGIASIITGSLGNKGINYSGGGFEVSLGAEVRQWVAFELNYSLSFHNKDEGRRDGLHTLMLETHAFLSRNRVRPYALIGLGAFFLNPDTKNPESEILTGPGIQLGVGIDIKVAKALSIGAKLSWRGMYLDDAEIYGAPPKTQAFLNDVNGIARFQIHF